MLLLFRFFCVTLATCWVFVPCCAEIRVPVMRGERELSIRKGFTRVGLDGVLVDVPSHRRRGKRFLHNDLEATKRDAHHDHNEAGCCAATTLFYLPSLCRYSNLTVTVLSRMGILLGWSSEEIVAEPVGPPTQSE
jgi:hypothetical protein